MNNVPEPPGMVAPLDLSIIVVNWNTRDLLANCLQSIYDTVHDLTFEVIVVDNASTDGSADMVRERFPQVRLIENAENVGFAKANNQGIKRSSGRYIVLLNSDTVVRSKAIAHLTTFLDTHPDAGACGPLLLNPNDTLQPSCYPFLTAGREFWRLIFLDRVIRIGSYPMNHWDTKSPHNVEVVSGACLALRREALNHVGLLDERYFMYSEEMDLCYRLHQEGWRIYWVPQAHVMHYGGQSTRQMAHEMYLQLYRSKAQFQEKFWGKRGAKRFQRLIRLAYWPRWLVASLFGICAPAYRIRAQLYRRLLGERFVT